MSAHPQLAAPAPMPTVDPVDGATRAVDLRALTQAASRDEPSLDGVAFGPEMRLCLILEPGGTIRSITEAHDITPYVPEIFIGHHLAAVTGQGPLGPGRGDKWVERIALANRDAAPARYADRYESPDGGLVIAHTTVTPVVSPDGVVHSIIVHMQDKSEAHLIETRLRESEAHFRLLAEALPQMVWVADGNGSVTYFSPRWSEFTGRTMEELVGEGYTHLLHPDDQVTLYETVQAVSHQDINVYTFRMMRHDGEYRWMQAHVHTVRDADGNRIETVGGTTDITEARAEDDARMLSQKRAAIGTLAGGVAHDFNNVISAIVSNAWVAEAELSAGESPAESIREIARGARRAGDLVKRLITFAREEEPRRIPFSLDDVVAEACALVGPTLPAGIAVRRSVADDLPLALGDSTQLHQVVLNLVTNAGYAIGQSDAGTIEISVDLVADGAPTPRPVVLPTGDLLRLRVRDNGAGIPSAVLPRVFDPFFTTKPAGEGTGLGLAAANTIIASHGGTISADSIVGSGTEFVVHLPAGPRPAQPELFVDPVAPPVAEPVSEAHRVMFVDDEAALTRVAPRAMAASGCAATTFTDPTQALDAFRAEPDRYDALVTDLSMPKLDGLSLIRGVLELRPDLPVVLSSGFMTADQVREAEDLGVGRIVPKPCSVAELAAAVNELRGDTAA